ncbi:MAG: hypothetical protein N2644_01410 [Candidatus Sumerlaea chitinivorans]|nr:hypothetical protein [Candidatus Sumerlaea chitinivorans]
MRTQEIRLSIRLSHFELFAVGATFVVALLPPSIPRCGLALFISGLSAAPLFRRSYRLTELIGVSLAVSLVGWSLLSVGLLPLRMGAWLPWWPVGLAALGYGLTAKSPKRLSITVDWVETAAWMTALLALVPISAVYGVNGPRQNPEGPVWYLRKWIQQDGLYFIALVQEAIERLAYPDENPFAAGLRNYYPSLLHCGFAGLVLTSGKNAPTALWQLWPWVYVGHILLLVHTLARSMRLLRKWTGLAASVAVCVFIALRLDYFVYPHTQGMVFGLLFFVLWLVNQRLWLLRWVVRVTVALFPLLLAWMHTVSTTAVWAAFVGFGAEKLLKKQWRQAFGFLGFAAIVGILALGVGKAPYRSEAGWTFDLRSYQFFMGYVLPHLPLYLVGLGALALGQAPWRWRIASAVLCLLGVVYTVAGFNRPEVFARFYAIFNAQRFPYLSFLFFVPALSRNTRVIKFGLPALVAAAILNPNPYTLQCESLVFGKALVIPPEQLEAFEYIRQHTPPRARFITNLEHWGLTAFTGRPQFVHGLVMAFGFNSLPEPQIQKLLQVNEAFFTTYDAKARAALLEKVGIRYVLVRGTWESDGELANWIPQFLPSGQSRIVRRWERLVLIEWLGNLSAEQKYLDSFE